MTGLFITGTDTEVGKSVVTAALAAGFRAQGRSPRAVKPLASGSPPPGEDASLIAKHAGHEPIGFACLPTPASPERAAREAGITIDDDGLVDWCRAQTGDPLLMEGVGGWAVPLTSALTVEDLAMAMKLPVLIVSANKLGMLNHTLLTVDAVRESGLEIAGIVVNNAMGQSDDLQGWNLQDLRRWVGPGTPITVIDEVTSDAQFVAAGQAIISALGL
jgi:dethiobiotin synthase